MNGSKRKSPFTTFEWLLGLTMLTISSIIHVAVLPFCDLVVLSPISAIGIVFNDILAVTLLKERLIMKYDATAVSLILIGSLLIVLLSDYAGAEYTPDQIRDCLWSSTSLVYMLVFIGFVIFTVAQYFWHVR